MDPLKGLLAGGGSDTANLWAACRACKFCLSIGSSMYSLMPFIGIDSRFCEVLALHRLTSRLGGELM